MLYAVQVLIDPFLKKVTILTPWWAFEKRQAGDLRSVLCL